MNKKDILTGILVLLIISALSGYLLAQVYNVTKPKILEQRKLEEDTLNKEIFQNGVKFEKTEDENFSYTSVYNSDDKILGKIFDLQANGYGGLILIKTGVDNELKIKGIRILEHTETPGLGSKITDTKFLEQFKNKNSNELSLKKDDKEGLIDEITGATISSRAVAQEIKKLQEELLKTYGEEL